MEFRNLLSDAPSESLDNYAEPHNSQQYWIDNARIDHEDYYTVYKGSFPNKERRIMTASYKPDLTFYIDGTKIAEYEEESPSRWSKEGKLYAIESFNNVTLRRSDLMVSHSGHLIQPESLKERELISDITIKSSFCKERVVVANPYFKSVKSYNTCLRDFSLVVQVLVLLSVISFIICIIITESCDFTYCFYIMVGMYGSFGIMFISTDLYPRLEHLCKKGKREMSLELVGIADESPYATIKTSRKETT